MNLVNKWWFDRREELENLAREKSPVRIYVDEILNEVLFDFLCIDAIERVFYNACTNPHPGYWRRSIGWGRALHAFQERK